MVMPEKVIFLWIESTQWGIEILFIYLPSNLNFSVNVASNYFPIYFVQDSNFRHHFGCNCHVWHLIHVDAWSKLLSLNVFFPLYMKHLKIYRNVTMSCYITFLVDSNVLFKFKNCIFWYNTTIIALMIGHTVSSKRLRKHPSRWTACSITCASRIARIRFCLHCNFTRGQLTLCRIFTCHFFNLKYPHMEPVILCAPPTTKLIDWMRFIVRGFCTKLLITDYWLLIIDYWLLITDYSSHFLAYQCSTFPIFYAVHLHS